MDEAKPYEMPQDLKDKLEEVQLWASYGVFMIVWQSFDELLEFIIYRETGMTHLQACIVLSGLGFERKASIARSLLALKGTTSKGAVSLINKITSTAERNMLAHGQVTAIAGSLRLDFMKRGTDQKLTFKPMSFDYATLSAKNQTLIDLITELHGALGITPAQVARWDRMSRSLSSKFVKSPNPPSS